MKKIHLTLFIVVTISSLFSQPINNNFSGAIDVSGLINGCSSDAAYTTVGATNDNNPGSCWTNSGGTNVWFKFVATTSQINIQLKRGGSAGTIQYPYMALWQSDGTTQVACMSNSGSASNLELGTTGLTIGNTYYISVDNHNGSSAYRGTFKLCLQDAVTYDFYEGAILLNDLNNYCSPDAAYTTVQATNDKNPGSCWGNTGGSNRWFKFVATTTQIKVQVKRGGTLGTIQYALLALWENDGTTQLKCAQSVSSSSDVELSYNNLTIGNTYYISVDNNNGSSGYRGTFTMCINDKADYDFYEAAEELTDLNNWCSSNAAYTTVLATKDKNKGSCWSGAGGSNRWFKFTANSSNAIIQLKRGGSLGSIQYPQMALWESNGTTQVACANYTTSTSNLTITTTALIPGNTYYISVDNYNGSSSYRGSFTLCIDNIDQIFYSLASGSWTVNTNWSNVSHSGAPSTSYPNIGDVVYIEGHNIALNNNITCAEVNVSPDNATTSLTIDNSKLTVTGVMRFSNNNKDFDGFITLQNNSTLQTSNDFIFDRSGGANTFSLTIGNACKFNIGRDLIIQSSAGSTVDAQLTANGTATLNVNRDVLLSNNGGQKTNIDFNNSSSLTVTRDLNFNSTAANKIEVNFNNTSKLNLYRDLEKSGGFGILTFAPTSTLNLIGNVYQQNVAGTTGTSGDSFTFGSIVVNNLKITQPQITLTGPVSVSGTFSHIKGVIKTTSANNLLLSSSNVPSIGSSSAYIDGPLNVFVTNTGASTINFPIGKGLNYLPAILYTNHTDAISVTYTAELISSSAKALGYTLPGTIDHVSDIRYWQIDRENVSNFNNASVRLYYNTNDVVNDFGKLTVAKTIGAGTSWIDIGGTATANGTGNILSGSFTSFSKFSLANKIGGNNPLPIELLYFNATPIDNKVNLDWATASEINNDKFVIERSIDGVNFEYLTSISAAGNSATKQTYNTIDENPYKGISYYRLKQVDYSGEFKYSSIVSVTINSKSFINLFPNPTKDKITINYSDDYLNSSIRIINVIGDVVLENVKLTQLNEQFDLTQLPAGIYYIEISKDNLKEIMKISVIK